MRSFLVSSLLILSFWRPDEAAAADKFPSEEEQLIAELKKIGRGGFHVIRKEPDLLVDIYNCDEQTTDAIAKKLSKLHNVWSLALRRSKISEEGFKAVCQLKTLKALYCDRTPLKDAWLKHLQNRKDLWVLELEEAGLSDDGVQHFTGLTQLVALRLRGNAISDNALPFIVNLKGLMDLDLDHTKITDASVKELSTLKDLLFLSLRDTNVTAKGVETLKKNLTLIELRR